MKKITAIIGKIADVVFPSNNRPRTFLTLIVIKLLFWFAFMNLAEISNHTTVSGVIITNDYGELLGPADNYADYGFYARMAGSEEAYTGRMPGYSAPYLALRMVFPRHMALPMLILLQIILMAWALSRMGQWILERRGKRARWIFLIAAVFLSFWLPWEIMTYPEIFALASFCLALVNFQEFLDSSDWRKLVISGFWFAWMFFLRGFLAPYLAIFAILIFFQRRKLDINFKGWIKYAFIFSVPFIIMEGLWIARNQMATGTFIPLQTSFVPGGEHETDYNLNTAYKPAMLKLRNLIACWGGDNVHFYPASDMAYFIDPKADEDVFPFPSYAYTSTMGKEQMKELRHFVLLSLDKNQETQLRMAADERIAELSLKHRKNFISEKPLVFIFVAPLMRTKNLIARNVVGNWPGPGFSEAGLIYKGWKGLVLLTYFLTVGAGLIIMVTRMLKGTLSGLEWAMALCVISMILLFIFVFNTAEFKYFMTANIILLYFTSLGLGQLLSLRVFKNQP